MLTPPGRDRGLDAAKLLLAFSVVLGHVIEQSSHRAALAIYGVIYSFHMPMFVFLAGWFSEVDEAVLKRRIQKYLFLYLKWGILYGAILFVLEKRMENPLVPFWILWFIFSLATWYWLKLILGKSWSWRVFVGTAVVALVVGAIEHIGYAFSAQRTLYFFPFFVAGSLLRRNHPCTMQRLSQVKLLPVLLLSVFLLLAAAATTDFLPRGLLYGSMTYRQLGMNLSAGVFGRLTLLALGFLWIATLLSLIVRIQISQNIMSGRNALSIYLIHGILIMCARKMEILIIDDALSLLIAFFVSILIVFVLGRDQISRQMKSLHLI